MNGGELPKVEIVDALTVRYSWSKPNARFLASLAQAREPYIYRPAHYLVGSRSILGNYGLSPYSFILRNRNGMGVEIGSKERYGMITDAHWVDINGDKKVDLMMCGDWMSILILENDGKGTLTNKSKEYGVDGIYGMWNSLAFSDLNKDGILDIIAGNTGLNHKWTASEFAS